MTCAESSEARNTAGPTMSSGSATRPSGITGAAIALGAIFLPSFLLLGAVLPLWAAVRERLVVQAAVAGIKSRSMFRENPYADGVQQYVE